MTKELLISSFPHETKVAVLEDDQLVEVYFQRDVDSGLVGGIYKGRVNRVLPGMQSAFVDIGLERDAFLYVSDFFEDSEEYDRVFTEADNRATRADRHGAELAHSAPAEEPVSTAEHGVAPVPPEPNPTVTVSGGAETEAAPEQNQAPTAPASGGEDQTQPTGAGEERKRDFHGRRNRRRGRVREQRFETRRESSERPREFRDEAKAIEPLPGESLAKYGGGEAGSATLEDLGAHAQGEVRENAFEPSSAPPTETMEPPTKREESVESEPHAEAAPQTEEDAAGSLIETALDSSGTLAQEDHFESVFASMRGPEDQAAEPGDEDEHPALAGEDEEASEHDAETPSPFDFHQEPREHAENSESGAAEAVPSGDASNEPPQAYTLRDSHQSSRVAPRRGRRSSRPFRGRHGRRQETGSHPRAGNHQPLPINELLREGQEILVQIAKEPLGTKGARITSHIALPGRYLVYMPTIGHIGVSRKIGSDEERLRLRNILLENRGSLTGGFIVRTAGAGRSEEDIKADIAFLTNLWNDIRTRAERVKAPALLHRDLTLVERVLRDLLSPDFKSVRVDSEGEFEHVLNFVNQFQPALIGHVKLYTRDAPLFEEYGAQSEIDKALKPKVWLKSGGYIVINQTEALVSIDVNTGKYVGKTNRLEDTIVKTNIDAVMEIVRQIRLRDLGGIIVIDFIDMDERRNRAKVAQALEEALRRDRAPTKIITFNEFGLVALTRKRAKQSLERTLCEPCPYCAGAGWVKSVATISNEIVSEARKMSSQIDGPVMTLRVNPQVAASLKSKAGLMISEIEEAAHKEVVVTSDPAAPQERFEIF